MQPACHQPKTHSAAAAAAAVRALEWVRDLGALHHRNTPPPFSKSTNSRQVQQCAVLYASSNRHDKGWYALSPCTRKTLGQKSATGLCWHGKTQQNLGSLVPTTHQSPNPVALPSMPISQARNNTQTAGRRRGWHVNQCLKQRLPVTERSRCPYMAAMYPACQCCQPASQLLH